MRIHTICAHIYAKIVAIICNLLSPFSNESWYQFLLLPSRLFSSLSPEICYSHGIQPWILFSCQHQHIYIILFNDHFELCSRNCFSVSFCLKVPGGRNYVRFLVHWYYTQWSSWLVYLCICANIFECSILRVDWSKENTCLF